MKNFISLGLLIILPALLMAQSANSYIFTNLTETYTEATGGQILSPAIPGNELDDEVFNNSLVGETAPQTDIGFPIGFNFTYRGIVYDRFAVDNNGYIVLGNAAPTFTIANSIRQAISTSTTAGFVNVIAPLNRDLRGQPGSELSFITEGTPGSQCLVVQWKNYRRSGGTSENINFQLRLYETSNEIKFCYGPMTLNYYSLVAPPQVGLRGATNADYHNRTFPWPGGSWNNTTKGAANNVSCAFNSQVYPANGLTFRFAPPTTPGNVDGYVYDYYSNPVTGATILSASGNSTTSGAGGYYNLTGLNSGLLPLTCSKTGYNPDLQTVTVISGATVSKNFTLKQPTMEVAPPEISMIVLPDELNNFVMTVTNNGNGLLNYSVYAGYPPLPPSNPLASCCSATATNTYEYISQVIVGSIYNISTWVPGVNYQDFTSLSTDMHIGSSYPITVNLTYPYIVNNFCSAWADWNQNGNLEPGEYITFTKNDLTFTANITPTPGALLGNTRLRIRVTYNVTPESYPCGNLSRGETEDYTIKVCSPGGWATCNGYTGSVNPSGGTGQVTGQINSSGFEPGEIYNALMQFSSNPDVGAKEIPVEVIVADPGVPAPANLRIYPLNAEEGQFKLRWDYMGNSFFDHFLVVRNGEVIAEPKNRYKLETLTIPDEYCYTVHAVYQNGTISGPAGPLCVQYPIGPEIPLSNWAMIIAAFLMIVFAVWRFRRG
jgi:hypothetical protein